MDEQRNDQKTGSNKHAHASGDVWQSPSEDEWTTRAVVRTVDGLGIAALRLVGPGKGQTEIMKPIPLDGWTFIGRGDAQAVDTDSAHAAPRDPGYLPIPSARVVATLDTSPEAQEIASLWRDASPALRAAIAKSGQELKRLHNRGELPGGAT